MLRQRKNRFHITGIILVLTLIPQITLASTFTDVPYDHPHSTAISYLQSYNIVEGYEDNTYRPENLINRVEFLKIVLEGTNVQLDVDASTGFSDIDESQWYGPYVKKGKHEGWIQGYPDNTFKPLQAINKVEALKILGEVQQWDRLTLAEVPEAAFKDTFRFSWYSPYVHFAKENGLLFEETDYLYPAQEISRAYMAELVYRSIIEEVIRYTPEKTAEDKIFETKTVETPDNFEMISSDFFDYVQLDSDLPNTFYMNEIYILEGSITNGTTYNSIFAFLSEDNGSGPEYSHLLGDVTGSRFKIPLIFSDLGTYQFGIIPGTRGESKIVEITVLDGIPEQGETANNDTPSNLSIHFENDTTIIDWSSSTNNVFKIYFIQDNNIHYYFVRDKKTLDVLYDDFKFFNEGNMQFRVYGARADSLYPVNLNTKWSRSPDVSFEAVMHHFKLSLSDSISHSTIPETLNSSQLLSVNGFTLENIFAEGAVITPAGYIERFDINTLANTFDYYGNEIIPGNSEFDFTYDPGNSGIYILEINSQAGSAVVNVPIYIGNIIPIIPDFFDLQDPFEITESINLISLRNELLNYLNIERQNHGLPSVTIRDDLNPLAQSHSDDMFERNYFSHINPEGESPDDRRIEMNISTEVGENLAHAPTVYFAHQALMRSAVHRENILNAEWDSVGIGITLDNGGYLLVAEEFSHDPWTAIDLTRFENEILDGVNTARSSTIRLNSQLQDIARNWSQDMIDQNFFSFISPSGINLIDVVQNSGITNEGRAYILKEGTVESLVEKLLDDSDVENSIWNQIGVGVKQDQWSSLYLTVIFIQ